MTTRYKGGPRAELRWQVADGAEENVRTPTLYEVGGGSRGFVD